MPNNLRQSTSAGIGCVAALALIIGVPLGLLIFGAMALTGYAGRNYAFTVLGLAAIGTMVAGLYCLFNPPRR
jgi:hypothetical protein